MAQNNIDMPKTKVSGPYPTTHSPTRHGNHVFEVSAVVHHTRSRHALHSFEQIHAELVEADKTVVQEHDAQYRTSDRVTVHARLLSLLTLSFLPLFAHGSGACIPPSFDQMSNASNPSATPLTSVTVSSGSYNQSTKMMQIGTLLKYDTPITPGQSVVISAHFGAYALPTSVPVTAATPHNLVQFSLGPMLLRATNPTSSGHYLSRYGQIELAHYTESYTSGFTTLYRRKLRLNYALYDNSTAPDFTE